MKTGTLTPQDLTASLPVFTGASKELISKSVADARTALEIAKVVDYQDGDAVNHVYSGIRVQCGATKHVFSNQNEVTASITFPVAFPTALLSLVATQATGYLTQMVMLTTSHTTSSANVLMHTRDDGVVTGTEYATWIAIGY
jgi:hypothetical protein